MLKQELSVLDYFGPLAVFTAFFTVVLSICVTVILWCCVSPADDAGAVPMWRFPKRERDRIRQKRLKSNEDLRIRKQSRDEMRHLRRQLSLPEEDEPEVKLK